MSCSIPVRIGILFPEVLNIIEASLFVSSATLYAPASYCDDYACDEYMEIHKLELTASVAELTACFGWLFSW